jgi:translocation and assembly module TamB
LRFLTKKRLLAALSLTVLLILALIGGLIIYLNSTAFDRQAQRFVIEELQRRTGATVTLRTFDWSFWSQRFRLEDLTLRGLEPPEETPLAHFDRIDIGLNLRTLLQKRIDLFELTLTRPEFHVIVGADGKTNLPSPQRQAQKPFDFQISIENFNLVDGSALVNERKIKMDFALRNLSSALNYQGAREVLGSQLTYDGVLDRSPDGKPSIPYTLSAEMDYTRGTLIAHRLTINSGKTEVKLQGRINDLLNKDISGKLEYTGNVDVPFLNYFFTKETFAGNADVAGQLEFSRGYFFTRGNATTPAVDFEGWRATNVRGEYAYHYPDKRLTFRNMKSQIIGGGVSGTVIVEGIPGKSRVGLDLDYNGVDAAALARVYPWDRKYRIFSTATGTLDGWFEGKLDRYEFSGQMALKSYTPTAPAEVVPLPLDGSTDYRVQPGRANVANADIRLYSTGVKADGLIHETMSDLNVTMSSLDLKDAAFIYSGANGSGTFSGTLRGRIAKPVLAGDFTLQNHAFREWKIERAAGAVLLDTQTEDAVLRNVRIVQGESQILVNGSTALSGSPMDLRVQSDHVTGPDIRAFINRDVDGVFAGDVRITSLTPAIKLEGDVRADNLTVDGRLIGDGRGHVRYSEPSVEITQLSIRQGQSTLTGDVAYNQATTALKFSARVTSVDFNALRPLGVPDSVQGVIRQANLRGDGTTSRPNIAGDATLQNVSFFGESFPQGRVELSSAGSKLDVRLDAAKNLGLSAQIDTGTAGYPFTARATFSQYPIERLAKIPQGTISVTGNANLAGQLSDIKRLRGDGSIETAEARIQDTSLKTAKPFTFAFTSEELRLTGVALTGESTQLELRGTIGLVEYAPLNLGVSGKVDLAVMAAAYPEWTAAGVLTVEGNVEGTVSDPDLKGLANLRNASLSRRGFFTSLTNVNGDMFFNRDQVNINNISGRVGGGEVRAQGNAVLQGGTVQAMNVRLEADNVRVRYPEGLRTVFDGALVLRGNWDSPILEGNLQIQNLAYRTSFEEFLALLTEREVGAAEPSPVGRLRLSVHVEGSRNITIQNQLADVEARVDVDVKGTIDNPSLTGHIEASGGTLLFQGNRYRITRGNIDFVDPLRIEPVLDVQAESEVRDYRVILSITGRGDKLRLDMRSDPPLPETEIISLIAGGLTSEEIAMRRTSSTGAGPTSEQLFQSGAASILFDLLQQRVGNRLGLPGLSRVRIDPFLVGAENSTAARITLSEQLTKDLSVTYSQDLSSNRQQIILIEYFLNRNTSILASRDELGNFGLDVRFRTRLK